MKYTVAVTKAIVKIRHSIAGHPHKMLASGRNFHKQSPHLFKFRIFTLNFKYGIFSALATISKDNIVSICAFSKPYISFVEPKKLRWNGNSTKYDLPSCWTFVLYNRYEFSLALSFDNFGETIKEKKIKSLWGTDAFRHSLKTLGSFERRKKIDLLFLPGQGIVDKDDVVFIFFS